MGCAIGNRADAPVMVSLSVLLIEVSKDSTCTGVDRGGEVGEVAIALAGLPAGRGPWPPVAP